MKTKKKIISQCSCYIDKGRYLFLLTDMRSLMPLIKIWSALFYI